MIVTLHVVCQCFLFTQFMVSLMLFGYATIDSMKQSKTIAATLLTAMSIWLVLGVLRFALNSNYEVHYHADFAMYINGEQLGFENPLYYEEVGSGCSLSEDSQPEERAHLHDQVASTIHVHDRNVTWGHFFNNIDYSIGEFHIETWDQIYSESNNVRVRYILNGELINDIKNVVIQSEDRLLVDYGEDSEEELLRRFNSVTTAAGEYNSQPDPSSCKGSSSSVSDRLIEAFFFI